MRWAQLLVIAIIALPNLGGCATVPPVWADYDACASLTSSFVAMVECGKQKRAAACQNTECSAIGNAFVQYADALAMQVTNHEISEAEALQRFAQYKTQVISDAQRNRAIAAAALPLAVRRHAQLTETLLIASEHHT